MMIISDRLNRLEQLRKDVTERLDNVSYFINSIDWYGTDAICSITGEVVYHDDYNVLDGTWILNEIQYNI